MGTARWVGVAVLVTAINAAAADRGWVLLQGKVLAQALSNQDFGDGVHFAYQFLSGGELRGMNMGKPARGNWRVIGNELCWHWTRPKEPEECYQVRQRGQAVRLYLDGQEVLSGNLTPLPANLKEMPQ